METKGKFKRDLVKNILIVFLLVMLILTFFSNTIMNRSLPEVSTEYAMYKQINDNIRATATVMANEDFVLEFDESREVASVEVRRGDRIERGQIIYTLVPNESNELAEAQKSLNLLLIQKQQMLKSENTSGGTDYDYEIGEKNKELNELKAELAGLPEYESGFTAIEAQIEALEEELELLNDKLANIGGKMNRYESTYDTLEEVTAELEENRKIFEEASAAYEKAKAEHDSKKAEIEKLEAEIEKIEEEIAPIDEKIAEYTKKKLEYEALLSEVSGGSSGILGLQAALEEAQTALYSIEREYHFFTLYREAERAYNNATDAEADALRQAYLDAKADYESVSGGETHDEKYYLDLIDTRKLAVSRATAAYEAAADFDAEASSYQKKITQYKNYIAKYELEKEEHTKNIEKLEKEIASLNKSLTKLAETMTETKGEYDKAEALVKSGESKQNYLLLEAESDALKDEIKAQNKLIEEKKEELGKYTEDSPGSADDINDKIAKLTREIELLEKDKANAGKNDPYNEEIKRLELANLEQDIANQQKKIESIKAKLTSTEIVSPVTGTVTSISYSAGEDINAGSAVATIAISEKGYTMEFAATNEQCQRVNIGDTATLQNYYWGAKPEIRVTALKNDSSNPGRGKIIVLSVTGDDITVGQSLTFTLGERARSYDKVVPNSAIREDSNGKFVLVVESKSTPLGNRYTAKRVDVEVITSDETSSALSGELLGGEFIITTASAPVSDGMQVRLAEK